MPTERPTRRQAILAVMALPLADVRVLARQTKDGAPLPAARGHLTIPLDAWGVVHVTYRGQEVAFTTGEIFAALKG